MTLYGGSRRGFRAVFFERFRTGRGFTTGNEFCSDSDIFRFPQGA